MLNSFLCLHSGLFYDSIDDLNQNLNTKSLLSKRITSQKNRDKVKIELYIKYHRTASNQMNENFKNYSIHLLDSH